jgi:hypothetical protein
MAIPSTVTAMEPDDDVMRLVRLLRRYLRENPLASDTREGIQRWWIGSAAAPNEVALEAALLWMAGRHLLEGITGPDGRVRYRRVQTKDDVDDV